MLVLLNYTLNVDGFLHNHTKMIKVHSSKDIMKRYEAIVSYHDTQIQKEHLKQMNAIKEREDKFYNTYGLEFLQSLEDDSTIARRKPASTKKFFKATFNWYLPQCNSGIF